MCPEPQFQPTPQHPSTRFWTLSSAPKSSSMVPLSTHAAARHHSTLLSQEATPVVEGTTLASRALVARNSSWRDSVSQGRKTITLVSTFYVSSFTTLCVLPRPVSGKNGLTVCSPSPTGIPGWRPPSFDAPSGFPTAPPNLCSMNWRGVRSSALTMQVPTGMPTLLPPLQRTVCSLMTSSSHSHVFT